MGRLARDRRGGHADVVRKVEVPVEEGVL
jgi:hypothetical protein